MKQSGSSTDYRLLTRQEISELIHGGNSCDDWNLIYVKNSFNPARIKNSTFSGHIYIGDLSDNHEPSGKFKLHVGIYNSTIISSSIGNNVAVHNVAYLDNVHIGDNSFLLNVGEITCEENASFGEGTLVEVANENGGKKILAFNGMTEADAWLCASFREDIPLGKNLKIITEQTIQTSSKTGGTGRNCVIKHVKTIRNCFIGDYATIDGASYLNNITVNSGMAEPTFIGSNVILENGIIGFSNKIETSAQCLNFITGRNVQIKLAARVLHTFVGSNSTIACCEVLHCLIFPMHEQHHNNSFLIASIVGGQSNIAAGATIGSNHNSRAADGEIIANRGFWPGLCSSFKHNSFFASYSLIAKADYETELNIRLPFSLISKDAAGRLLIFPGFWFRYNMYALTRNTWKFQNRDKRVIKDQHIEFDFLAPDTIWEMMNAIGLIEQATMGHPDFNIDIFNYDKINDIGKISFKNAIPKAEAILIRPGQGVWLYKAFIAYAAAMEILNSDLDYIHSLIEKGLNNETSLNPWQNFGGQLIPHSDVENFIKDIKSNKLGTWRDIHSRYDFLWASYPQEKAFFILACYMKISNKDSIGKKEILQLLKHLEKMDKMILDWIIESRQKDYTNDFRSMIYKNEQEMNAVIGNPEENPFISETKTKMKQRKQKLQNLMERLNGK
jgi:hypothetical protein